MNIQFTYIDDVYQFNQICQLYDGSIKLSQGKYVVDAKSILGIFSMNLQEVVTVEIETNYMIDREQFYKAIERWSVE